MTYTFTVQIDLHEGQRPVAGKRLALAIYRAIEHAKETDIAGTEVLTYDRFGQVSVKESRPTANHQT